MESHRKDELVVYEQQSLKAMKSELEHIELEMYHEFVGNTPAPGEYLPTESPEDAHRRNIGPINEVLKDVMTNARWAAVQLTEARLGELLRVEGLEFNLTVDQIKRRIDEIHGEAVTRYRTTCAVFREVYKSVLPDEHSEMMGKQEATIMFKFHDVVKLEMQTMSKTLAEMKSQMDVIIDPTLANNEVNEDRNERELAGMLESFSMLSEKVLNTLLDILELIGSLESKDVKLELLSINLPRLISDYTELVTNDWSQLQAWIQEKSSDCCDVTSMTINEFQGEFKKVHESFVDFWNTQIANQVT